MRLFFSAFFLLFICHLSVSQTNDFRQLTKAEYYKDFDTLYKWITSVSPMYLVNDKLKKESFSTNMKELRRKIDIIKSNQDFLKIVINALNLIQDPHAALETKNGRVAPSLLYPQSDTIYNMQSVRIYDSLLNLSAAMRIRPNLPIKYIDGSYVVYYPFKFNDTFIDTGFTVTLINGKNIHSFIKANIANISTIKYDLENEISFKDNFYRSRFLFENEQHSFTMQFAKGNIRKDVIVHINDTATLDKPITAIGFNVNASAKKILWIDSLKILYIRMPLMTDGNYYIEEIKKLLDKKPRKIIFDIRGNGGGNDWPWVSALKLLIKSNEIVIPLFFGLRNTDIVKNNIHRWLPESLFSLGPSKYTSPLLKDGDFLSFKTPQGNAYTADSMSMQYGGKIYLFCHGYEYSSGGNFIDIAKANEKIVTVGMTTGLFGGTQFSPIPFILPNSKIIFHLEPTLDFKQVETAEDFYHNYIDIPYKYSVLDLYNIATYRDVSDLDFLLWKDPLFKLVKDLK